MGLYDGGVLRGYEGWRRPQHLTSLFVDILYERCRYAVESPVKTLRESDNFLRLANLLERNEFPYM